MKIRDAYRVAMNMSECVLFGITRNLMKAVAWPFNKLAEKLDKRMATLITQAKERLK